MIQARAYDPSSNLYDPSSNVWGKEKKTFCNWLGKRKKTFGEKKTCCSWDCAVGVAERVGVGAGVRVSVEVVVVRGGNRFFLSGPGRWSSGPLGAPSHGALELPDQPGR